MRTVKLKCGCEFVRDARDDERVSKLCMEHEQEFIVRHAAAAASCSHINRDLIGEALQ